MTAGWKAWKTQNRFPTLPTDLGNRYRDSHIPTAPTGSFVLPKLNPKGVLRSDPPHLSSGSFFDEKMLTAGLSEPVLFCERPAEERDHFREGLIGRLRVEPRALIAHEGVFSGIELRVVADAGLP